MNWDFQIVTEDDFPLLYQWILTPHVKEFWYSDKHYSFEEIRSKYLEKLGDPNLTPYLVYLNQEPIGYIQVYTDVDLNFYQLLGAAVGIDLYIGEKKFLHKGYGPKLIEAFLTQILQPQTIQNVCIDPEEDNVIAIKAYQKAGFVHFKTKWSEKEKKNLYYMTKKL